jgi:predicted transcriptional regulator YdeE
MEQVTIKAFNVIGISVRTTNENGQSGKDIEALWGQFMKEGIHDKIPNKIDNTIYSLYTEYESDHTKPYTTIIGCKVEHLNDVPSGMISKAFDGGKYVKITAKGDLTKGLIVNEWKKVWDMNLDRKFNGDYEAFGENAKNPNDSEVDFLVSIH